MIVECKRVRRGAGGYVQHFAVVLLPGLNVKQLLLNSLVLLTLTLLTVQQCFLLNV